MISLFVAAAIIAVLAALYVALGVRVPVATAGAPRSELLARRERLLVALNELDTERADSAVDATSARDEELRLSTDLAQVLKELESPAAIQQAQDSGRRMFGVTAIVLAVAVPAVAGTLYAISNANMATGLARMAVDSATGVAPTPNANVPPMVLAMVGKLEDRLRANPNDADGWSRLGRSYLVLERRADALTAYRKAFDLAPGNPQVLAEYAWLVFSAHPDDTSGLAHDLYVQLNKLDPANPDALWFLGLARYRDRDVKGALDYWQRLARLLPKESPEAAELEKVIAKARAES